MTRRNAENLGNPRQIGSNLASAAGFPLRHRTAGNANEFSEFGLREARRLASFANPYADKDFLI